MSRELIKKTIECEHCKKSYSFEVRENGFEAWENGEYIQDALYDIEDWQRELLMSSTCNDCFDKVFGD